MSKRTYFNAFQIKKKKKSKGSRIKNEVKPNKN